MVLCKYFMEGYCKYGSRCRFQHNDGYDGYETSRDRNTPTEERTSGKSILKGPSVPFGNQPFTQANTSTFGGNAFNLGNGNNSPFSEQFTNQECNSSFGGSSFSQGNSSRGYNLTSNSAFLSEQSFNQNKTSFKVQNNYQQHSLSGALKFNVQEIMEVVSKDVLMSEKGNQWPLSAYSPHKDLPNLHGLEDHMPEELRWECYKALQSGTLPLYQAIIQQLYSNVAKINNDLRKKESAYAIINTWLQNVEKKPETPMASPYDSNNLTQDKAQMYSQSNNDGSFTFSLQQQKAQVKPPSEISALGGSKHQLPVSGSRQNFNSLVSLTLMDNQPYSQMEQLAEKDIEAFKGDKFFLGSIPTKSPPKELCN